MSSNNVTCTPHISMHYFRREFRANSSAKVIIIKDLGFVVWAFWANQKTNRPILRLDWRLRLGRVKSFQIQTHKLSTFLKLKLIIKHQYFQSEADHHKPAWLWNSFLFCTHVLQPLATRNSQLFFFNLFFIVLPRYRAVKGFSYNAQKMDVEINHHLRRPLTLKCILER